MGPYDAWIFDCDGVLLDSNFVKTEAFRDVGRRFGNEREAEQLVLYHQTYGGVSRFVKMKHFLIEILRRPMDDRVLEELVGAYGEAVRERLLDCRETPGLRTGLASIRTGRRFVVSGGLQSEVEETLTRRGIASQFEAILGSPRTKDELFTELRDSGRLGQRAVYFGDSLYDFEVATRFEIDFVFVFGCSEFTNGRAYFTERSIPTLRSIGELSLKS